MVTSRSASSNRPTGSAPGTTTTTSAPCARSRGTTPARTSELLPDPEGPTTADNPWAATSSVSLSESSSRPKNDAASASSNGRSPLYGLTSPRPSLVSVAIDAPAASPTSPDSRVAVAHSVRRTASVQASTKSAIVGYRSAGWTAVARCSTSPTGTGTSERYSRSGGTGCSNLRRNSALMSSPWNGARPASSSQSITPSAYWSLAAVAISSRALFGARIER